MNKKVSLAPRIAFILLVLVTLGCGASAQATATEAIKEGQTEVVATQEPTEAPVKVPDMSAARIFRQQLPGGFEEIPMDDVEQGGMLPGKEEYLPEVVFAYVNKNDFQLIIGMNFLLVDAINRIGFSAALKDTDTLKEFAGAIGGENIRDEVVIETMDDLGEKRSAMAMVADVEGVPMNVNVAIFQRGVIGGIIMSMSAEGEEAKISFEDLGQLFDKRVQESLERAQ